MNVIVAPELLHSDVLDAFRDEGIVLEALGQEIQESIAPNRNTVRFEHGPSIYLFHEGPEIACVRFHQVVERIAELLQSDGEALRRLIAKQD